MKHTKQPKPSGQECKYCNGMGKYEIAGCVYTCSCKQPPPPPSLQDRSEKESEWEKKIREPLDYISKWLIRLQQDAKNAEGYDVGEKQVVAMNISKVQTELKVAKLILKEDIIPFIRKQFSLSRHQYAEELKGGIKKMEVDSNGRIKGQKAVTGNQVVALNSWKSYNQALQDVLSLLERKGEK